MFKRGLKAFFITAMKVLPFILWGTLVISCIVFRRSISIETITSFAPDNLFIAAFALIFAYAIKSLAVFFPLIVLNIACGMMFDPIPALIINTVGVGVMTALPYYVGRLCGPSFIKRLEKRYPKITKYIDRQKDWFFLSFFLRIISCMPGDIVSLYFGAVGAPFKVYFIGSMLGIIPGVITATFMGVSILDPTSSTFILSVSITVFLSVLSIIIHRLYLKR